MSGLSLLARILFSKTCALRSTVPSAATSAFFVLLGISCSEPYSLTCHFASHSRPSLAQCLTFIPVVGRCRVTRNWMEIFKLIFDQSLYLTMNGVTLY